MIFTAINFSFILNTDRHQLPSGHALFHILTIISVTEVSLIKFSFARVLGNYLGIKRLEYFVVQAGNADGLLSAL